MQRRCHAGSHVKTADAIGSRHAADRRHALGFAKVRYVLNALSLGFGVLYIAPGVRGALSLDPLPPLLLGSGAEAVEATDAVDVCGRSSPGGGAGADGSSGDVVGSVSAGDDGSNASGGQRHRPSSRGAVFLVRPTAAAVRCTFDWITSMWVDRKRRGDGAGGGSGAEGSIGVDGGSGGGAGGGSGSGAEAGGRGEGVPPCCSESVHFGQVMPECLELFGSGLGALDTGAFNSDVGEVDC